MSIGSIGGGRSDRGEWFSRLNQKVFSKIDSDGDGSIGKPELQAAFDSVASKTGGTARSADPLFTELDRDGDGKVTESEFGAGAKGLLKSASTVDFAARRTQAGDELFSRFDADSSGGLDAGELQSFVDARAARVETRGGKASADAPTGAELLTRLDTDGNGSVSRSELAAGRPQRAQGGGPIKPPPVVDTAPTPAAEQVTTTTVATDDAAAPADAAAAKAAPAETPAARLEQAKARRAERMDRDGDGTVSTQERAAADLKALIAGLIYHSRHVDATTTPPAVNTTA